MKGRISFFSGRLGRGRKQVRIQPLQGVVRAFSFVKMMYGKDRNMILNKACLELHQT